MAPPINAPVAGEIWHLSIEDLFQPMQEASRLGGEGPFVINLSVSTAPITVPTRSLIGRSDAHVYQIQVSEDGRTRYRLRLGPFVDEDEADTMLAEVRDTYPGALTATASGSDLRVIESMEAKANQRKAIQRAAEKFVTEKAVSLTKAADAPAVPQKPAVPKLDVQNALPQKAAAPKVEVPKVALPKIPTPRAGSDIIDAAVRAEIAKVDAEISIDIAWPTPELKVPSFAPPIAKAPAAPVVQTARAVDHEISQPSSKASPAPTQPAKPAVASASVTAWVLPELDIPLPSVQSRPTAPAAAAAPAAPAKPVELKIDPPLSLVNEAPVLTEVVVPRKSTMKSSPQKPVVNTPVLTEAVMTKGKPFKKPATVAPGIAAPVMAAAAVAPPPVVAAPVTPAPPAPPAPSAKIAPSPVVTAAPVMMAPPVVPAASVASAPPALTVVALPIELAASATAVKTPVKPVAAPPFAPRKPAYVLTQSLVTPRKPTTPMRTAPAKTMPNRLTSLQHVVVATATAPAPREVKKLEEPLPDLESTQTIRALTPRELEDNEVSRWFVIQLALADHAFDPEAVPNLDIFDEYRLYSVAGLDQGRVVHALRLGFFREEIGAVAVAAYLAAYWEKPTIKRVSVAERERFANQRVEARKDVGATGKHSVIEITDELVARRRRSSQALDSNQISNSTIEH